MAVFFSLRPCFCYEVVYRVLHIGSHRAREFGQSMNVISGYFRQISDGKLRIRGPDLGGTDFSSGLLGWWELGAKKHDLVSILLQC